MESFTPSHPGIRAARTLVAAVLLSVGAFAPAFAAELDAKLAIARAQASIDLISKENPVATADPSFVRAQESLVNARDAEARDDNREAVWFATESELMAERTLAAAKLAELEKVRLATNTNANILQLELRSK
jgi:hypothetical protein